MNQETQLMNEPAEKPVYLVNEGSPERRPWGAYQVLDDNDSFKVKKIEVLPKQRLSYQMHSQRSEHWFIVEGEAIVTLNDKEIHLRAGESVNIPIDAAHRIANPSDKQVLIFIEVQLGTYFGEDDIVRLSDDYGRR